MDILTDKTEAAKSLRIHPATLRDRLPPFLCGLLLILPAIIVILIAGGIAFASLTEIWRVKNWSVISAVVERSQALPQPSGKYKVDVHYHYKFGGREFDAECYEAFNCHELLDATKASGVIQDYPAGSTINVYVDPAHPRHSFVTTSMNSWLFACSGIVFFLFGLFFFGYCIYLMRRSVTALCIVRRWVSAPIGDSGRGIAFYFYDSLEAAQKDAQWSSLPKVPLNVARWKAHIVPFLMGVLFACIGIAGLIALIIFHDRLPGLVIVAGYILMPMSTIMGIGAMRASTTAKYILERTGPYGHKEISLLNSQDIPPP